MADRADWKRCTICGHLINPDPQVCDEAWTHKPCDLDRGCVPADE